MNSVHSLSKLICSTSVNFLMLVALRKTLLSRSARVSLSVISAIFDMLLVGNIVSISFRVDLAVTTRYITCSRFEFSMDWLCYQCLYVTFPTIFKRGKLCVFE